MDTKDFIVDLEDSSSSSDLQVIVEDKKTVQAIPHMPMIDGTKLFDFEIDNLEEKPWRKPGADITDYFNYGFDEVTWKLYCARQKGIREDFKDHKPEKKRYTKDYDRRGGYERDYDRRKEYDKGYEIRDDRRDSRDYERKYDRRDDYNTRNDRNYDRKYERRDDYDRDYERRDYRRK